MDAEVVAIDINTREIRPFQELSTRPRKDVKITDPKQAAAVFVFDLLYFNGEVCHLCFPVR